MAKKKDLDETREEKLHNVLHQLYNEFVISKGQPSARSFRLRRVWGRVRPLWDFVISSCKSIAVAVLTASPLLDTPYVVKFISGDDDIPK
jgi:hypothetical protein